MKPSEPFTVDEALWRSAAPPACSGRGWSVFVDEHEAPQPVVIDVRLRYRCTPAETGERTWINYEQYCERVTRFLETKPHTRLLETLAVELAVLSFEEWGALDTITLVLHKPKIRPGTQRIGIELDWTRGEYDAHRRAEKDAERLSASA